MLFTAQLANDRLQRACPHWSPAMRPTRVTSFVALGNGILVAGLPAFPLRGADLHGAIELSGTSIFKKALHQMVDRRRETITWDPWPSDPPR